jgi:hypothetical protein
LSAEIAAVRKTQETVERELREVKKEVEKERKAVGREREDLLLTIEGFEAGAR